VDLLFGQGRRGGGGTNGNLARPAEATDMMWNASATGTLQMKTGNIGK
jgi:hypothetical protein